LALNFRLAVNMLQLIYALKKHNNWRFPTPSQMTIFYFSFRGVCSPASYDPRRLGGPRWPVKLDEARIFFHVESTCKYIRLCELMNMHARKFCLAQIIRPYRVSRVHFRQVLLLHFWSGRVETRSRSESVECGQCDTPTS
jgi:hypothetical protein